MAALRWVGPCDDGGTLTWWDFTSGDDPFQQAPVTVYQSESGWSAEVETPDGGVREVEFPPGVTTLEERQAYAIVAWRMGL